ncbi:MULTISPECIES: hypothetical protein [Ciceribacter]|uniref:YpeB-like protein with protease inhibitory function n=1 Tax=Ciceribacter lividus TaxID=1197950 RepID=A0A6I7HRA1_9HYPH|nr:MULTISPECIES: hypothetical protein [Ciceribacter]MCO6177885.1 hypothetical protein [Ciceribacter sp. RN22]RCW27817.1 hypothetical protein DFR48_102306 [Ciceribacter lividus]
MRRGLLTLALLAVAPGVFAQDAAVSSQGSSTTMAELIKQGYEIKAAVPNGSKFIVFLQKENSAYACEFASLQNSRCGSIN